MHSCPVCGQACYCAGDIEDHDTGREYADGCECCIDVDEHLDDSDDREGGAA